ncbi:MAG: LuxR C-terminal-related transcriptional regulator [Alkalispirochaetaceae bacterium]
MRLFDRYGSVRASPAIFFFIALAGALLPAGAQEQSVPVIDLRAYDFSDGSLAPLSGGWAVYWERLLEPRALSGAEGPDPDGTFDMPSTWNDWVHEGSAVGGLGYATFAVRVLLPPRLSEVGLRVPNASTAYRLWSNGELVADSGVPGTDKESTTPHYRIVSPSVSTVDGELFLLLQVANFDHRRGGMWRPIEVGRVDAVESKSAMETTYDLLLIGSFAAMTLYNLLLFYLSGGKTRAPIFLALLFGTLVFRIPMMGQMIATRLIDGFPWALQLRIEYMTAQFALLAITLTLREIYPTVLSKRFTTGVVLFVALNLALVTIGSVYFYSLIVRYYVYTMILLLFYETLRLALSLVRGNRAAWYGIGAAGITFFITLGETIHYQEFILSRDFAPFGFLITLFAGDSVNQTTTYMISTGVNLLLLFLVANLLALRGSQTLLSIAAGVAEAAVPNSGEVEEGAGPAEVDESVRIMELEKRYGITRREGEIIRLVAQGLSNKEIASELYLSEATVKTHMYKILRKTGYGNRTELGRAYFLGPDSE